MFNAKDLWELILYKTSYIYPPHNVQFICSLYGTHLHIDHIPNYGCSVDFKMQAYVLMKHVLLKS